MSGIQECGSRIELFGKVEERADIEVECKCCQNSGVFGEEGDLRVVCHEMCYI